MKNTIHIFSLLFFALLASCSSISHKKIEPKQMDLSYVSKDYISFYENKYQIPKVKQLRKVRIAIIDSGINTNIKDIQKNIYNPENIENFFGYDLTDCGVQDTHGHGTHIAGIILGVNPEAEILPIKYDGDCLGISSRSDLENELMAIELAIILKVDIINLSVAGKTFSETEYKYIQKARDNGIIVIAALGNKGEDADYNGFYPASYQLDNVVSVANFDPKINELDINSNYSINSNSLALDGNDIVSLESVTMSGTSQATAFMTGALSLYLSNTHKFNSNDYGQLESFLKYCSNPNKNLSVKYGLFEFSRLDKLMNH